MKTALICGSFDPVTRGHEDLIRRAAALFDRVEVVMFLNPEKQYLFSAEERLAFLAAVCHAAGPHVSCGMDTGTVAAYTRAHPVDCLVRGVRGVQDLEYETQMAVLNRMAGAPETLFLPATPAMAAFSSSAARQFLAAGLPTKEILPACVEKEILSAYRRRAGH